MFSKLCYSQSQQLDNPNQFNFIGPKGHGERENHRCRVCVPSLKKGYNSDKWDAARMLNYFRSLNFGYLRVSSNDFKIGKNGKDNK